MKNKKDLDIFFMDKALQFAEKGVYSTHPNPRVGAIVVKNNKILGQGYHRQPGSHHAEYSAIKNSKNSCSNSTLYVTLEPCIMCGGASFLCQLEKIVYGASDKKRGFSTLKENILHPKTQVKKGILEEQCVKIIKEFFQKKRQ